MHKHKESITSKICAFARAYHSNYNTKKIFDDYLAFDLLGKDEYEYLKELMIKKVETAPDDKFKCKNWNLFLDEYISPIPLSRIAYTEDKLKEFANRYDGCQYVICGAGLDSFSFRNENSNIEIFELDHPNTQNHKIQRIKQLEWIIPAKVHLAPIDFEHHAMDEILMKSGYDRNKKTFFSILGVSYYLTSDTLKRTLQSISRISSLGSIVLFDYPEAELWQDEKAPDRVKKLRSLTKELGENMTDGFNMNELSKILSDSGFHVIEHLTPKQIQKKYFENRSDSLRSFENVHFMVASYEKERKMI